MPLSEAKYSRDQLTVREIRAWNGRIAIQVVQRGWTELARADAKPIAATSSILKADNFLRPVTLPAEEHFVETLDLVDDDQISWALVKTHFGQALWRRDAGSYWLPVTVPDMVRTSSQRLTLVPTGKSLPILLGDGAIYFDSAARRNQGMEDSWDVSRFPPEPRHITLTNMGTHPRHISYRDGSLYLGFDAKWRESKGVGLYRLDMQRNEWTNLLPWDRQLPIVSLYPTATALWAATGEMHGTTRRGDLLNLTAGKTYAAIDSMSMTRTENWDLAPAAPMDMDLDVRGNVRVLTGEMGLLRSTGRSGFGEPRWERLTAREVWDQYIFVTAFLVIADRYALIGTVDMGLLVWDLHTHTHWRIRTV